MFKTASVPKTTNLEPLYVPIDPDAPEDDVKGALPVANTREFVLWGKDSKVHNSKAQSPLKASSDARRSPVTTGAGKKSSRSNPINILDKEKTHLGIQYEPSCLKRTNNYSKKWSQYVVAAQETGRGLTIQEAQVAEDPNISLRSANISANHIISSASGRALINEEVLRFLEAQDKLDPINYESQATPNAVSRNTSRDTPDQLSKQQKHVWAQVAAQASAIGTLQAIFRGIHQEGARIYEYVPVTKKLVPCDTAAEQLRIREECDVTLKLALDAVQGDRRINYAEKKLAHSIQYLEQALATAHDAQAAQANLQLLFSDYPALKSLASQRSLHLMLKDIFIYLEALLRAASHSDTATIRASTSMNVHANHALQQKLRKLQALSETKFGTMTLSEIRHSLSGLMCKLKIDRAFRSASYIALMGRTFNSFDNMRLGHASANKAIGNGFDIELGKIPIPTPRGERLLNLWLMMVPAVLQADELHAGGQRTLFTRDTRGKILSSSQLSEHHHTAAMLEGPMRKKGSIDTSDTHVISQTQGVGSIFETVRNEFRELLARGNLSERLRQRLEGPKASIPALRIRAIKSGT